MLRVKIRDEGLVKSKAAYVALAFNPDGEGDTRIAMRVAPALVASGPRSTAARTS